MSNILVQATNSIGTRSVQVMLTRNQIKMLKNGFEVNMIIGGEMTRLWLYQ